MNLTPMKKINLVLLLTLPVLWAHSQRNTSNRIVATKGQKHTITWLSPVTRQFSETEQASFINFSGVQYETEKNFMPFLTVVNSSPGAGFRPVLSEMLFEPLTHPEEQKIIKDFSQFIGTELYYEGLVRESRKQSQLVCKIVPFRKNKSGAIEKLVSFNLEWQPSPAAHEKTIVSANNFAASSVLATGNWYKIGVTQSAVYKLDRNFFISMGLDPDSVDPRNIRIYGNGGRMLPESNLLYRPDDLVENAIFVQGESDGNFDNSDYVLFYGQSPHQWIQQNGNSCIKFRHKVNVYSDTTYYFITTDLGAGKRIAAQASSSLPPTNIVTSFDDYQYYESNSTNLIKSGREWYGEYFDIVTSYSYNFSFPNIVANDTVSLEVGLANRMGSIDANAYSVTYPGGSVALTSGTVSLTNYTAPYAADGTACTKFICNTSTIPISITKNNAGALGWLNYIRLNARRQLSLPSQQLAFRDTRSVGPGKVAQYSIAGAGSSSTIWDITDIYNITSQQFIVNGSAIEFTQTSDSLHEYIVFGSAGFATPQYFGRVANQNLHAVTQVDYIIVSHPDYLQEAQRIADLHAQMDTLSYVIVTPQQLYNEFSSGSQDIVGIRDFVRMLYTRASTAADAPKFLLLFGDGSYRYKSTGIGNTNFIPTYQSPMSLQPTGSYTSDDFFGLLDPTEGDFTGDAVDIGTGRLPARTLAEATAMVNKIINYTKYNGSYSSEVNSCDNGVTGPMGDWRNWVCFVADDSDADLHVIQADSLGRMVSREHPFYNVNKIYFDAYKQESTPGGQAYPDVNREFDKQVDKGCLILNYTGHGGELGLAHEGVVGIPQIQQYTNSNRLPMWFTATCEFSRYDDPDRTSAGEYVLLNPEGAGIALFTTVRLVYANSNFTLSLAMWDHMLDSVAGHIPAMGEVFMLGKQQVYTDPNTRNFTLLGDPALRLAYPRQVVITDSINGVSVTAVTDTLKALSKVTVRGHISDANGNKLSNFNGIIYPVVFDKAASITTLSNDADSPPFTFRLQKNIIYKGKSSVTNGEFTFTFIVPKDIAYNYGFGRISYYGHDGFTDATGYYNKAVVGGSDPNAPVDNSGPDVKLYLNDNKFVSGGTTNENPKIYAEVSDSSGINTVGNGIGHDIVALLDENSNAPIVLNDYYQADMNSYRSGKILYALEGLSEGTHKLSLKVWDVQNNSNTAYTEFVVAKTANLALTHVLNYPNPFTTRTEFYLEHNNCCSSIDVVINIFTISGKEVKSINKTLTAQGFRSEGIEWDGRDEYGDKLGKGVYIYKVKIKDTDGKTAEQYEKLVILN